MFDKRTRNKDVKHKLFEYLATAEHLRDQLRDTLEDENPTDDTLGKLELKKASHRKSKCWEREQLRQKRRTVMATGVQCRCCPQILKPVDGS